MLDHFLGLCIRPANQHVLFEPKKMEETSSTLCLVTSEVCSHVNFLDTVTFDIQTPVRDRRYFLDRTLNWILTIELNNFILERLESKLIS